MMSKVLICFAYIINCHFVFGERQMIFPRDQRPDYIQVQDGVETDQMNNAHNDFKPNPRFDQIRQTEHRHQSQSINIHQQQWFEQVPSRLRNDFVNQRNFPLQPPQHTSQTQILNKRVQYGTNLNNRHEKNQLGAISNQNEVRFIFDKVSAKNSVIDILFGAISNPPLRKLIKQVPLLVNFEHLNQDDKNPNDDKVGTLFKNVKDNIDTDIDNEITEFTTDITSTTDYETTTFPDDLLNRMGPPAAVVASLLG